MTTLSEHSGISHLFRENGKTYVQVGMIGAGWEPRYAECYSTRITYSDGSLCVDDVPLRIERVRTIDESGDLHLDVSYDGQIEARNDGMGRYCPPAPLVTIILFPRVRKMLEARGFVRLFDFRSTAMGE